MLNHHNKHGLQRNRFGWSWGWKIGYGIAISLIFIATALFIGIIHDGLQRTLYLIAISIVFEAQPAAAASIPLGFHPFIGVTVSILSNLILIPIILLTLNGLERLKWVHQKMEHAKKWTTRYQKYGVFALTLLSPFLGAYVCIAIGFGLQWSYTRVLLSVAIGVVLSSFIIGYGGHLGWQILHFGHLRHLLFLIWRMHMKPLLFS